jgi:hypothetical protein
MPIRTIISDDVLPRRRERQAVPDSHRVAPFWSRYTAHIEELHRKIAAAVRAGLLADALKYELELDLCILVDGVPDDRLGRARRS